MSGTINNGRRAQVSFGPFSGVAGVNEVGGAMQVAFAAEQRRLANVEAGTIDGDPYRVLKVERSGVVKGMVVLTVERAG